MRLLSISVGTCGIALSVIWFIFVGAYSAYEFNFLSGEESYFFEVVAAKTKEPIYKYSENLFLDLIPTDRVPKIKNIILATALPVVTMWIIGYSFWYVLAGNHIVKGDSRKMRKPIFSASIFWLRLTLLVSIVGGVLAICLLPPPMYFNFDRLFSGLPQKTFGFDPIRYLEGVAQRNNIENIAILITKFNIGFAVVWLSFLTVVFILRGRQPRGN